MSRRPTTTTTGREGRIGDAIRYLKRLGKRAADREEILHKESRHGGGDAVAAFPSDGFGFFFPGGGGEDEKKGEAT